MKRTGRCNSARYWWTVGRVTGRLSLRWVVKWWLMIVVGYMDYRPSAEEKLRSVKNIGQCSRYGVLVLGTNYLQVQ